MGVLALGLLCSVVAFSAITRMQGGQAGRRLSLMELVLRSPTPQQVYPGWAQKLSAQKLSRYDYPWTRPSGGNDPFGFGTEQEDPYSSVAGIGYGFEPELDSPIGGIGDGYPLYSPEACIPQTFAEMPPGYICSSPTNGAYALDPYGNLYGRRIQYKLRKFLQGEEGAAERTARSVPEMTKHTHHFNWVSPMDWFEPHLLPNASVCQELVNGFYAAISSPMSEDLVNATAFLDDNFVYSGSDVALVPGCVADVPPGYKVRGAKAWAKAYARTVVAFGNTSSVLSGNVSCIPQRNKLNKLLPTMKCVAHHHCIFELKSITNSSGLLVTLEGNIYIYIYIFTCIACSTVSSYENTRATGF